MEDIIEKTIYLPYICSSAESRARRHVAGASYTGLRTIECSEVGQGSIGCRYSRPPHEHWPGSVGRLFGRGEAGWPFPSRL